MQVRDISHLKYKRLFFSVNDNFLTSNAVLDADINYCIQCPVNVNSSLYEFYTLLIELSKPIEEIWEGIYHRTRDEINSFLSNQEFEYKVLDNLSKADLDYYINLYNEFAKLKGIRKAEKFRLQAYNLAGIFAVSFIKQKDEFLCINFYRVTKGRAANLYTFHLKHKNAGEHTASHFGRAHRALHWLDIQRFKEMGIENYDFCGWYNGTEDKSLVSINQFKEQFTKNIVKEYSGVIYNSIIIKRLKK